MSSILTRNRGETAGESMRDTESGPLMQVLKVAIEESGMGTSSASRGDKIARAFLVIDVGAAANRVLRGRGAPSEAAELVEPALNIEAEEGGQGRGTLSKLFLLGVVVGLGYVLRSRSESGSVGEVVDTATERAQTVADETARRSGELAQRTTAVTGQVADRIEQTGETAAERVEETGEMAADRIEESGEMAADTIQEGGEAATGQIEEATETVEEMEEEAMGEGEESEGSEETEE